MANKVSIGELEAALKLKTDKGSFQQGNQEFRAMQTSWEGMAKAVEQTGQRLSATISQIASLTAGIRSGLVSAQDAYTQAVGRTEQASRDLLEAQYQTRSAMIDVGRITNQQTLPGMQLAAAAAKDLANYLRNNPQIAGPAIQAAGIIGTAEQVNQGLGGGKWGGLAGGGVLAVGGLAALTNATAGQTGILGSIHGVLAQGFNGAIAAIHTIAPETADKLRQFLNGGGVSKSHDIVPGKGMPGESTLAHSPNQDALVQAFIQRQRQIEANERQLADNRVDIALQMARAIIQQERQAGRERQDMVRDTVRQQAREEQDYQRQQIIAARDYLRQRAQEERDFARQRRRELRDEGISVAREQAAFEYQQARETLQFNIQQANAQHEFEVAQRRAGEDHNFRLLDLAASRDALGIFKENRQFNVQKQRAQEDYDYQRFQANQQRQIQLKDELYQYNLQRKYRLEDFARRIADENQDMQWRREQELADFNYRKAAEAEALAFRKGQEAVDFANRLVDQQTALARQREDMATQYNNQLVDQDNQQTRLKRERDIAFNNQIVDLDHHLVMTQDEWNKFYDQSRQGLLIWIGDIKAGVAGSAALSSYEDSLTDAQRAMIGLPPRNPNERRKGDGGYAASGVYTLGERGDEYVLNNSTTRAAEAAMGGRLSQDALLAGLRGGGLGGGSGLVIHQNYAFYGSFTEGDKVWFRQAARDEAVDTMTNFMRQLNRKRSAT